MPSSELLLLLQRTASCSSQGAPYHQVPPAADVLRQAALLADFSCYRLLQLLSLASIHILWKLLALQSQHQGLGYVALVPGAMDLQAEWLSARCPTLVLSLILLAQEAARIDRAAGLTAVWRSGKDQESLCCQAQRRPQQCTAFSPAG